LPNIKFTSQFQYFNPCFAGCSNKTLAEGKKEDEYTYSGCSCIEGSGTADSGLCKKNCKNYIVFFVTLGICWGLASMVFI
jgi:hypothetical protein